MSSKSFGLKKIKKKLSQVNILSTTPLVCIKNFLFWWECICQGSAFGSGGPGPGQAEPGFRAAGTGLGLKVCGLTITEISGSAQKKLECRPLVFAPLKNPLKGEPKDFVKICTMFIKIIVIIVYQIN